MGKKLLALEKIPREMKFNARENEIPFYDCQTSNFSATVFLVIFSIFNVFSAY